MKEIIKDFGVVYLGQEILAIKRPDNEVYPSKGADVFECDTEDELEGFIKEKELE